MANSPAAVAVAVLRDNLRPEVPSDAPEDYVSLMRNAWDSDPTVRPKFLEIMTRLDSLAERGSSTTGHGSWTTSSGTGGNPSVLGSNASTGSHTSHSSDPGRRVAGLGARAPTGELAIVFSDIVRAMALWEHHPEAMKDATIAHNSLLRSSLLQFDGYEVSFFKFVFPPRPPTQHDRFGRPNDEIVC
jgi:hypothetical protein